MQFKPITAIIVLSLVAASLLVSGCSSPTTSNNPTTSPALTMSATYTTDYNVYSGSAVVVNATVYNAHAGTLKVTTDNFILQDSLGYTHTTTSTKPATIIIENGESEVSTIHFEITAGSTPYALTYYDGTNKVECTIS